MGIRREGRANAAGLYLVREKSVTTIIQQIREQLETCMLPGLTFDVHMAPQEPERLFIRYAFDQLPKDCRFGPAGRCIRESLVDSGLARQADNGIDLQCGKYRLCIGAVHSSMLAG